MSGVRVGRVWSGLAVALMALALVGCGTLDLAGTPATFDLSAPRDLPAAGRPRAQLTIAEPSALQALDSNRILVRASDGQVTNLAGAQWADRLPRLLQVRLVQSFENATRIGAVARAEEKLAPDVALTSEIRAFEIDSVARLAVVEVSVKLISERSGRIGAATVIRATRPAGSITPQAASSALNEASQDVLRQIVAWTVSRV
jgi:cholesterol transport system auxiliary component